MPSLSSVAVVIMLGWQSAVGVDAVGSTAVPAAHDSLPAPRGPIPSPVALGLRPFKLDTTISAQVPQDTLPRRPRAVEYSDAYYKRLAVHRALSWAMLPLFAASYVSGDQLLSKGDDAPGWAKSVHPVAATGSAVLFGANTVTGLWNLWDGRHDANGRTRRLVHSALFLAASGGFTYAGAVLADEAEQSAAKRRDHRTVALTSMGVSTASWLLMKFGN
jgi:hypothetical protein